MVPVALFLTGLVSFEAGAMSSHRMLVREFVYHSENPAESVVSPKVRSR